MIASRRTALTGGIALAGSFTLMAGAARAASASELYQDGRAALNRLYENESKARLFMDHARAVLIFPRIIKAGFIVGAQTGDGVLLQGDQPLGYYNISAASYGLQAGAQEFSYALFFMNDGALQYLRSSDGWSVGAGPSIVVMDKGKAFSSTTTTMTQDVYAFPFGASGLMAGMGIEGSKITQIYPN